MIIFHLSMTIDYVFQELAVENVLYRLHSLVICDFFYFTLQFDVNPC